VRSRTESTVLKERAQASRPFRQRHEGSFDASYSVVGWDKAGFEAAGPPFNEGVARALGGPALASRSGPTLRKPNSFEQKCFTALPFRALGPQCDNLLSLAPSAEQPRTRSLRAAWQCLKSAMPSSLRRLRVRQRRERESSKFTFRGTLGSKQPRPLSAKSVLISWRVFSTS
jgi:hypothetical protein